MGMGELPFSVVEVGSGSGKGTMNIEHQSQDEKDDHYFVCLSCKVMSMDDST